MTKKVKSIVTIGFPILMFVISATLYYITTVKYEKSFIALDTLRNSKIELEKENYNLYSLSDDSVAKKNLEVNILENKTHDTLNISILNKTKSRFIWASQTTNINGKKYEYLSTIKISKKGFYNISIHNSQGIKIRLVIQNQNSDSHFFKSILTYYLLSIFSIILILIVSIIFLIKTIRNKKV